MPSNSQDNIKFLLITAALLLAVVGAVLAHSFGMLPFGKGEYITVIGTSTNQEKNNIASFSVGVYATNEDKTTAVDTMNSKAQAVIAAIKDFGVPDEDVQTSNLSVYQEQVYSPSTGRSTLGDWRASTNIEITLRDVSRAEELAALLNRSELEADNVYGPNFRVDQQELDEASLMAAALTDAREKADVLATASGRKLGRIVNLVEGYDVSSPYLRMNVAMSEGKGGAGTPLLPGSSEVSKTVTVTFRLR